MDIRNHMDDFGRRLKEMEDSIELIAQYVKKESIAAREMLSSKEEEKLASIEALVTNIRASLKKDVDSLIKEFKEAELKQSIEFRRMLEERKDTGSEKRVEAELDKLSYRITDMERKLSEQKMGDTVLDDYNSSLAELERKINAVNEGTKAVTDSLRKEMRDFISTPRAADGGSARAEVERLQSYINDSGRALASQTEKAIQKEVGRLESLVHDSMKLASEEAEGKMQKEIDRLENLVYDSGKLLTEQGMEQYLDKVNRLKGNLERYFNVKTQLLENRIKELGDMVKSLESNRDYVKIEENLANLEAKMRNDVSQLQASNKDVERMKGDVENIKSSLRAIAPEADIVGMEKALSSIRQKLDVLESKDAGKVQAYMEARIADINRDIAQAREKLDENVKKMSLDFTYKINQMKKTIEEEAEKFKNDIDDRTMSGVRKEVADLRHLVEEQDAKRISLEKNVDDLANTLKTTNAFEEADELKRAIEEDQVNRAAMEKKVADLESNIASMRSRFGFIGTLKKEDIEKIQKDLEKFQDTLKNMEKDINIKSMNIVMQQLHDFSDALDKKMPDLVGRDEFLRSVREIKSKTGTQVDITKFALRLENVERQLDKISKQMSSLHGRLPFVVE